MGIALGLGAALSWGLADYVATRAVRMTGTIRVVVGFHVVATVLLAILVLATGALGDVGLDDLPLFVVLGVLGWGSYVAFYAALRIGPISIVSPIVSGYAAVTVLLAVVILGERLSTAELVAIVVSLAGVVLVSVDVRAVGHPGRARALGTVLAVATMGVIGAFVFGVSYRTDELGWLAPIFLARGFTLLFLLGHARFARVLGPRDRRPVVLGAIALLAVLDTAGYVFFTIGTTHEQTAIVAAATAPYALVPVALGVALLHERPARSQWAGIALVLVGLVVLGLASG
jgi:drug/metabolite transporter (DMT)-like permease